MWSFGCILYELYIGYPLFPGEDEKEHMAMKTDDTDHSPCSYKVTGKRDQRGLIDLEHGLIFTAVK